MRVLAFLIALGLFAGPSLAAGEVTPLPRAHAHNDYEHPRPLLDALDHGFTSVEADVWLVGDALLVAHDEDKVRPGRDLRSLYLDPLRQRVAARGGVHGPGGDFTLLVDLKSEAEATYAALDRLLSSYPELLTTFGEGGKKGPVTVVVTGNRPRATMLAQPLRLAGYDGRLADLDAPVTAEFMPLISDNWTRVFTWTGQGEMPPLERDKLAASAHARGQRLRFWATPDTPGPEREAVWNALLAAGVDLINSDDLAGLRAFLAAR